MMKKENYCRSRELAQRVLLECGVAELPVDVASVSRQYGIAVKTYKPKNNNPGQAYVFNGSPIIPVSVLERSPKQRFICAHELGHVLMGHVGPWRGIPDNREMPHQERAAMIFAAELLMPPCVMLQLGINAVDPIMELCGVPYKAAFYTLKELERQQKGVVLLSAMEKRVCREFAAYIEKTNNNN